MRIAIIGSGVSGLVTAHLLQRHHDVVLYESDERPGGHSHTHRVELPELTCDVDTGFLVYNERTYPLFCRLLDELGVASKPSDMSFSVADQRTGLEWRGTSFSTVFAQRRNLARPDFLRMLADVARFNRSGPGPLGRPAARQRDVGGGAGPAPLVGRIPGLVPRPAGLVHLVGRPVHVHPDPGGHLRPLLRTPRPAQAARPAEVADRRPAARSATSTPSWARCAAEGRLRLGTPVGKIRREPGGVEVVSEAGVDTYDHVVLATHSDQALSPALGPRPDGARDARRAALPAEPGHPAHRRQPAAHRAPGLGQLELPPPRGRAATRPRSPTT